MSFGRKSSRNVPSNLSVLEGIEYVLREQPYTSHSVLFQAGWLSSPYRPICSPNARLGYFPYLVSPLTHPSSPITEGTPPNSASLSRPGSPASLLTPSALKKLARFSSESDGLWSDIKSMRWMRVPASSFKMILYPVILYSNYRLLQAWNLVPPDWYNPFEPLLFISHRIPDSPPENPRYQKGYFDLLFIAFYVIVWSFIRQSVTSYVFDPFGRRFGIKKPAKLDRFGEQGYAIIYFSFMSILGLVSCSASNFVLL